MRDVDRALADISDIRIQMAASKMFKGFGAQIIAMTGVLAVLITGMQSIWPDSFAPTPLYLIGLWVVIACVSIVLIGLEMLARSRRHHGSLADSMNIHVIETFLPTGAAGAVIGFVLLFNAPDTLWALPGLWQILVGLSVFSALKFLPRRVIYVATWYFIAGAAVLIYGSISKSLTPLMVGLPFIVGQFLMASIMHIALEAPHAKN